MSRAADEQPFTRYYLVVSPAGRYLAGSVRNKSRVNPLWTDEEEGAYIWINKELAQMMAKAFAGTIAERKAYE